MFLLGIDIGSSSVKTAIIEVATGRCIASDFFPKNEAPIKALQPGWAEQRPDDWWDYLCQATRSSLQMARQQEPLFQPTLITSMGISWQMHGLVCLDRELRPLRDAIIWCDSRAVPYGQEAFQTLGPDYCLTHLLNSPGNFTAAKLAWVKEHEPHIYQQIHHIMLPGDYIALRLTGEPTTTIEGLSEAILWDFPLHRPAWELMDHYGFPHSFLPPCLPNFAPQGLLTPQAAQELGLPSGIPLTYRAGDQPNNALSLNVLNPGEIASTAGTSGVVYGVNSNISHDPQSRVNSFAHVNHSQADPRLGVLLCINGTGILNSWLRHNVTPQLSYAQMNQLASTAPIGCQGLSILPFGNGAERMLCNQPSSCTISGLSFPTHTQAHLLRAAQEGIVFAFRYGLDIMQQMGVQPHTIRAGRANMFQSPLFAQTLSTISQSVIELYDTDGAQGAARGAALGAGAYSSAQEAFSTLQKVATIQPNPQELEATQQAYHRWVSLLNTR